MKTKVITVLGAILFLLPGICIKGQPVFTPWGNVTGISIEGEKMEFEASLRAVDTDWKGYVQSEKYNWEGRQTYTIEGKTHSVSHEFMGLPVGFTTSMTEKKENVAGINTAVRIIDNTPLAGIYYCMEIPGDQFSAGSASFYLNNRMVRQIMLPAAVKNEKNEITRVKADKIVFRSDKREYTISSARPLEIIMRSDFIGQPAYLNDPSPRQVFVSSDPVMKQANYQAYFTLMNGNAGKGKSVSMDFEITATGSVDKNPVIAELDVSRPGRKFDGIGGTFRLQFPAEDPAVIDYCLENLDVKWARLPFYWDLWHPEEDMDPVANARSGNLNERFNKQMEMAVRLAKKKIPLIFSVWWPPKWSVDTLVKVPRGQVLDNSKLEKIGNSIASFFLYIKEVHGIEAEFFSFNEADYGVEVFQTPENHAIQLKSIGMTLASKGLKTKLLIGDTGAGTGRANKMISVIEKDPELHKYAGAVSFHTYHGVTTTDLQAWARSADETNLPVLDAEGGSNSAAHRYPLIFLQPWFQLDEIDKYIRICAICQPFTIIEWQLTADYSVLTGNGLYGDNGPLRPTQRFWNLKQLGLTPEGSFALPLSCDKPNVTCTAFGDILNGIFTLHFVNNGAKRNLTITGLPPAVKKFDLYITDAVRGMEKISAVDVVQGQATLVLEASAYTTLINNNIQE